LKYVRLAAEVRRGLKPVGRCVSLELALVRLAAEVRRGLKRKAVAEIAAKENVRLAAEVRRGLKQLDPYIYHVETAFASLLK